MQTVQQARTTAPVGHPPTTPSLMMEALPDNPTTAVAPQTIGPTSPHTTPNADSTSTSIASSSRSLDISQRPAGGPAFRQHSPTVSAPSFAAFREGWELL